MSEQRDDDADRTVLTDAMRARTGDMLPGRASDPGGTAADSRLFMEAVPWRFRTGSPWRAAGHAPRGRTPRTRRRKRARRPPEAPGAGTAWRRRPGSRTARARRHRIDAIWWPAHFQSVTSNSRQKAYPFDSGAARCCACGRSRDPRIPDGIHAGGTARRPGRCGNVVIRVVRGCARRSRGGIRPRQACPSMRSRQVAGGSPSPMPSRLSKEARRWRRRFQRNTNSSRQRWKCFLRRP